MGRAYSRSQRHGDIKISLVATIIFFTLIYLHRNGLLQLLLVAMLLSVAYFMISKKDNYESVFWSWFRYKLANEEVKELLPKDLPRNN